MKIVISKPCPCDSFFLYATILLSLVIMPSLAAAEEGKPLELDNNVVCRVGTEAISKRDVEERMGEIPYRIRYKRQMLEQAKQLTKQAEEELDNLYIDPFRDALRRVVRERLMLQQAKSEKLAPDEKAFEKKYLETVTRLKSQGLFGANNFTPTEVQKKLRENMLLDEFRARLLNLEQPNRPQIEQFYNENISRFQRKAGVKVRLIRIDRFLTDKRTGKQMLRENSRQEAEKFRDDIVKYGALFSEEAKAHSDDSESAARGGLLMPDIKDAYFDPDGYNRQLADAIRGLKPGDVSNVFELGQASWAFALVEDRREAGPAPLDESTYKDAADKLRDIKFKKKEDDWFRKALSNSLIQLVVNGTPQTLPVKFFFPDDSESTPGAQTEAP